MCRDVTYKNTKWEQIQCCIKNTAFHWGLSIFCCCNFHPRPKAQTKQIRPLQRKMLRAAQFSGSPPHTAAANHVLQWSLMNIKTANYTTWHHTSAPVHVNSLGLDQVRASLGSNHFTEHILCDYFRYRFAIGTTASFTGRTNLLLKQTAGDD